VLLLAFGSAKTIQLVTSANPTISYFSEEGHFTTDDDHLDPINFRFAVSVIDLLTK
jgi:hypothetical protein